MINVKKTIASHTWSTQTNVRIDGLSHPTLHTYLLTLISPFITPTELTSLVIDYLNAKFDIITTINDTLQSLNYPGDSDWISPLILNEMTKTPNWQAIIQSDKTIRLFISDRYSLQPSSDNNQTTVYQGIKVTPEIGAGIAIHSPMNTYEGTWYMTHYHGHGIRHWPNSFQFRGIFNQGIPISGSITDNNGDPIDTNYMPQFYTLLDDQQHHTNAS